jgi:hypothetical protein
MKKAPKIVAAAALATLLGAGAANAQQTATANLNVSATVAAEATLTLTPGALNFPASDPDTIPSISGVPTIDVVARVRTSGGGGVTLAVQAGGPLTSGGDTIPAANVSWNAGGAPGFVDGTVSVASQNIGSWVGSGRRQATLTFALLNSWTYAVGNYTMTLTYTLTAP